jgi:hypothetical protein
MGKTPHAVRVLQEPRLSYDFAPQKQIFLLAAASARVGDRREVGYITGIGNIEFRHKRIDSMKAKLAEGFDAAFVGSGALRGRCARPQGRRRQIHIGLDGLWLENARHANVMARRLADGLSALPGTRILYPVEAGEIFIVLASGDEPGAGSGRRALLSLAVRPSRRPRLSADGAQHQSVRDRRVPFHRPRGLTVP